MIAVYHEDVTGDDSKDTITLYGVHYEDTPFFKEVWAIVETKNKDFRIDYQPGFEPELSFSDLTHDGILDIYYSSATGGSGGLYNTSLHTIVNDELVEIALPTMEVTGEFKNKFKVEINIEGLEKIELDVSRRKADYLRLKIYNKKGKLLAKRELMIDPIAFYEIIDIDGKAGLKSYQQISGAYHADGIGVIEASWLYDNNKWNLVNVEFITK